MRLAGSFDVFFSYARRDHAAIEQVARALADAGVGVFLDRWYLAAGQPWPQALEAALAGCRAVAVFIGADGLGPWQQRERDLALERQTHEPGFPVIPVLLTRSDPGLGFLGLNTWVDLAAGIADTKALTSLAHAIRGEPPGPQGQQRSAAARAAVCPYRGLRPFREEDEPFFFGRRPFSETLTATAVRQPVVAVVGASGSGKSSVVRAGLLPRLRQGAGRLVWDALTLVPTDRPLVSLAAALLPMLEPDLSEVDRLAEVSKLAAHFTDGTVSLRDVAGRLLARQPGTDRLLLFVDQWEELYTLGADDAVRNTFIEQLLQGAAAGSVHVVLTLRGDFMGHALGHRTLSDRLQDAVVTVGPMTRDELAETIVRPAAKIGLGFEQGLVETILDEVGEEPGTLPLLEFLLEGLWKERHGTQLTHEAYARLGRVSGAIAHRAEEVFAAQLSETERTAAQRLLIRMVRPGEGVEDTRRRTALQGADSVAETTIRKLAAERLIVTARDAGTGVVTAEVAHEALIRSWQRLRDWIDDNREFLRTRDRIAGLADQWQDEGRPADRLLPPGRPLAEGEDLLLHREADIEPRLVDYIKASAAAARTLARRRQGLRVAVMLAMAAMTVVAIGFARFAWQQWEEADRNAAAAQRSESRALAALAEIEVDSGSPATALRVALAALPRDLGNRERMYAREAEGGVWRALSQLREDHRFAQPSWVTSVAFSPDGKAIAVGAGDNTVRVLEAVTGHEIAVLHGHGGWVSSVAFSADGRQLVTGAGDRTARVWDTLTGKSRAVLAGHDSDVESVAFSPDGRLVVTGADDMTVRLWDAATGKERAVLRGHSGGVHAVAFSPDGRSVASGSEDRTLRLWDVAGGKEIAVFVGHEGMVSSVAFTTDGRRLATASADETVRLWNVATGKAEAVLRGHNNALTSVAFSRDGRQLVTGSEDKTARLWDAVTGKELAVLRGHDNLVASVAFSADGSQVATGSWDNTVRLWQTDIAWPRPILRGHDDWASAAAFSPDGERLATGSWDQTVRLWDAATGALIAVLNDHASTVTAVAFSPDGRRLATGSLDATVRVWDVLTGKEVRVLRGQTAKVAAVAFSPDGLRLASGTDDETARLWDMATGKELAVFRGHGDTVNAIAFSPDGRLMATGGGTLIYSRDNSVRLWEVASGKAIAVLHGHDGQVTSVVFSPDGKLLASTSEDHTVRLWEVASGKAEATLTGHKGLVTSVAFSPDGKTLATGSNDKTARLWDVAAGRPIAEFRGHESSIIAVAFSPDGETLATVGGSQADARDNTAQMWPVGSRLIELACAAVHDLPLTESDKQRFGIADEWCTPEVSTKLAARLHPLSLAIRSFAGPTRTKSD